MYNNLYKLFKNTLSERLNLCYIVLLGIYFLKGAITPLNLFLL